MSEIEITPAQNPETEESPAGSIVLKLTSMVGTRAAVMAGLAAAMTLGAVCPGSSISPSYHIV